MSFLLFFFKVLKMLSIFASIMPLAVPLALGKPVTDKLLVVLLYTFTSVTKYEEALILPFEYLRGWSCWCPHVLS